MAQFGYKVRDCDDSLPNIMFRVDNILSWEDSLVACLSIPGGNLASIRNFKEFNSAVMLTNAVVGVPGAYSWAIIG